MKKLLIAILLLVTVNISFAEKTYGNLTITKVDSVHDGDTFTITVPKWPAIVGEGIEIRVNGIDTPEIRGKCKYEIDLAYKAKEFTTAFLTTTSKIYLKNMSRDMYFRIDADVIVDGKSLSQELIKAGLGYEYYGATKKLWCPAI